MENTFYEVPPQDFSRFIRLSGRTPFAWHEIRTIRHSHRAAVLGHEGDLTMLPPPYPLTSLVPSIDGPPDLLIEDSSFTVLCLPNLLPRSEGGAISSAYIFKDDDDWYRLAQTRETKTDYGWSTKWRHFRCDQMYGLLSCMASATPVP